MELQIDIEFGREFLLVNARGVFTFDSALKLLKVVLDTAKETQVKKILVDCDAVHGELSTLDRYSLGSEVAEYVRQLQLNPIIAFVGKPATIDGFAIRVSQNQGLFAEVFAEREKALRG